MRGKGTQNRMEKKNECKDRKNKGKERKKTKNRKNEGMERKNEGKIGKKKKNKGIMEKIRTMRGRREIIVVRSGNLREGIGREWEEDWINEGIERLRN